MATNPRIQPIERATATSWNEWLAFMESINAPSLSHHQIATRTLERLTDQLDNPAWWAQSIAVAYQQHVGRRIPGQRPDGTFQTSVSKATRTGMSALMTAWTDFASRDKAVLDEIIVTPKVGGTDRRLTWRTKAPDGIVINVLSEPKPNGNASIIVQHIGSPTADDNERAKTVWADIITRFLATLPPPE